VVRRRQKLIDDPEVDAVYVATPPGSHLEYAVRVAAAGKPAYVEKPMARDHAECARMVDAFRSARGGRGVPLFVAYYRRSLPRALRVKQLIDDGAIGAVRFVQHTLFSRRRRRSWRPRPAVAGDAGGGRRREVPRPRVARPGPVRLPARPDRRGGRPGGEPGQAVRGRGRRGGTWAHQSGVLGSCVYCFTASERVDRCEVVGTNGVLTFQVLDNAPIELRTPAGGVRTFAEADPEHVQQPMIQAVVDELRGVGSSPSTGESAARASWVMDQMLAGWRAGKGRKVSTGE
jgi:predicted dehydrogenase